MRLRNFPLVVLSLLISLGLWVYVRSTTTTASGDLPPGTFSVEVKIEKLPAGFLIAQPPSSIVLTATGTPAEINRVTDFVRQNPDSLVATADLSAAKYGEQPYPLKVETPKGFELRWGKVPDHVSVKLDEQTSRQFKVEVDPINVLPEGEGLGPRIDTEPKMVTIYGRRSKLDQIDHVNVQLNLAEFRGAAMNGSVHIFSSNGAELPIGDPKDALKPDPAQVTILAALIQRPSANRFVVHPTIIGQPAPGYKILRIDVEPNQVVVRGPSELLARTFSVDTKTIDITGLKANRIFTTKLDLPEDLHETKSTTIRVTISVGEEGIHNPLITPPPSVNPTTPPNQ